MTMPELSQKVSQLEALLQKKARARDSDLETWFRKSGRSLPAHVRQDLALVFEARSLAEHPKLSRQIQADQVRRALMRIEDHLGTFDPAQRRKDRLLSLAGVLMFNLLLIAALLIAVLMWRGFL